MGRRKWREEKGEERWRRGDEGNEKEKKKNRVGESSKEIFGVRREVWVN